MPSERASARLPLLLTLPDVARELSVSDRTVARLVGARVLPTVRIGRSVRIPSDALMSWLAERLADTNA
ncbi:MAG: helix-turn-helix domain-containing protein [Candidatus Limnocylindrales bacterium]